MLWIGPAEPVVQPLDLDPLRPADPVRDEGCLVAGFGAVEHERRRPHGRQDLADVALHRHPVERDGLRRARAAPLVPDEPFEPLLVLGAERAQPVCTLDEIPAVAPPVSNLTQLVPPLLVGRRPRVIRRPEPACGRVVEDHRARPLGVRGREQKRDPRALLRCPEHGSLGVDRVHHRAEVVHPRLQRRHLANRIGKAAAPLVEEEHATRLGHAFDVLHEERHVPPGQKVGERSADEHDVDRPLPDHLVGDCDLATSGVADVRDVHGRILPSWQPLRPSGSS